MCWAGLNFPGTKLSYPLLQGEDNEVYLDHNWKRNLGQRIDFLECTNKGDFSGFHTIIYGHRMKDNSMFGVLKYYMKVMSSGKEHPAIYIADGESVRCYRIFAAHETDVKGMVYRLDLEKEIWREFVRFCSENSVLDLMGGGEQPSQTRGTHSDPFHLYRRGHDTRWVVQGYLSEIYSNSPLYEKLSA